MELAFTDDVSRKDGTVKFRKGTIKDFPKDVWEQIAASAERELADFTSTPEELAVNVINASKSSRKRLEL